VSRTDLASPVPAGRPPFSRLALLMRGELRLTTNYERRGDHLVPGSRSDKAAIFPREPAIRVMLARFISQPTGSLSDRPDLTVGDITVQFVAQPEVDPAIP